MLIVVSLDLIQLDVAAEHAAVHILFILIRESVFE